MTQPLAVLLAAALVPVAPPAAAAGGWRTIAPGLEFRVMDAGEVVRKGPRDVAVARVDPSRWRLDLFHHEEPTPAGTPAGMADAAQWQARLGAAVVFNAGQYYPDRRPMGLFVKDGRNLGTPLIKAWKGILAAEPRAGASRGAAPARILDLEHDTFSLQTTPYRRLMQSFMLLDQNGRKRVRRSDWHANRTVVAIDREGRLIVMHTAGACTLWELADWIARADLGVRHAMSMDGGFEAQLCVRAGGFEYLGFGSYHVDDRGDHSIPGLRVKLPAVVCLLPRG